MSLSAKDGQEAVVLALCRLDPALSYRSGAANTRAATLHAFAETFELKSSRLLMADSLGRWDLLVAARLNSFDFHKTGILPEITGMKKLDIQYGYAPAATLETFFKQYQELPCLLMTYLHIREDLMLRVPAAAHAGVQSAIERAGKAAQQAGMVSVGIHMLGWPDFAVLTAGTRIDELIEWARSHFWDMSVKHFGSDCLACLSEENPIWPKIGAPQNEVAFSRTYTVVGVGKRKTWHKIEGELDWVQVDMRVRSGSEAKLAEVAHHEVQKCKLKHDAALWSQPGGTDVTLEIPGRGSLCHTPLPAKEIIPWYLDHLLRSLAPYITTTEMRIGVPITGGRKRGSLSRHPVLRPIPLPETFLARAEQTKVGASVAVCIRNMCRMLNLAITNDGLYEFFVDIYLHSRVFLMYLESEARASDAPSASLLAAASDISALFFVALGQRMCGTYYDLTADKPESLLEYFGGQQKAMICLWWLQYALLRPLTEGRPRTFGYWLVSRQGEPAECVPYMTTFIFQVCSSLAFDLGAAGHVLGHEIAHAVYKVLLSIGGVEDEGLRWLKNQNDSLKELLQWFNPDWRETTRAMLEEVFADLYAFFLFMEADGAEYQRSLGDLVLRVQPDDRFGLAQMAVRAWVVYLTSQAFPRGQGETDHFWAVRQHGTAKTATNVINIAEKAPANRVGLFVNNSWQKALAGYSPEAQERLSTGWVAANQANWLRKEVLDCLESIIQHALRSTAWCLGYDTGGEGQSENGWAAEQVCSAFLEEGAPGGLPSSPGIIEMIYPQAMAELGKQIQVPVSGK